MNLLDAMRIAYKEGCGLDLDTISSSPEVARIINETLEKSKEPTPKAALFIANPWTLSRQLQESGKIDPVTLDTGCIDHEMVNESLLLYVLGEALLDSAKVSLPQWAITETKTWNLRSPVRKQLILKKLMLELREYAIRIIGLEEDPSDSAYDSLLMSRCNINGVLPATWRIEGNKPSCLGIAMLIAAFAELAGAEFYLVTELSANSHEEKIVRGELYELAFKYMIPRFNLSNEMVEAGLNTIAWGELWHNSVTNFHHGVLIKCGEKFVLIDPYHQACETWNSCSSFDALSKYGNAATGLVVTVKRPNPYVALRKKYLRQMRAGIRRSGMLEQLIGSFTGTPIELFKLCGKTGAVAWALQHNKVEGPFKFPVSPDYPRSYKYVYFCLLLFRWKGFDFGQEQTSTEQMTADIERFGIDEVFRRRCIKNMLLFLVDSVRAQFEQEAKALTGSYLSFEAYGCAYTHLGLLVANAIRCGDGVDNPIDPRMLLHSASQVIWHDSVDSRDPQQLTAIDPLIRKEIRSHISRLSSKHRLVQAKWDRVSRLRDKGDLDGKTR